MREKEVPVRFEPSGRQVHVLPGTRLLEAAAGAGIVVDQPCGGEGKCGKCRVLVAATAGEPTAGERAQFSAAQLDSGWRLACQTTIDGRATVEVPASSLLDVRQRILARAEPAAEPAGDPPLEKRYVEMPPPARGCDSADLVRLQEAVGPCEVELELLRALPGRLRAGDFRGTAVLAGRELIDFEVGHTEASNFAVAFDVGTTTLVAELLDVHRGAALAVVARQNPQTRFGDDVLSRIQHAGRGPQQLADLHETIVQAVDAMVGQLAEQAAIGREQIYQLTFSGNTTMQQLLCRIDPRWLGEVPFVPATTRSLTLPAAELGIRVHPRAQAYVMPVIGGFVGGDTVSGMLATALAESEQPTLLVDIGTNGELVLAASGKLSSASTAAGPAFEGARISHGMRGTVGAIEKVVVDGRLRSNVIGDVPAVGLCGSGLIDLAAELLRHGVLTSAGRLRTPEQLPRDVAADLARRIVVHQGQVAFELAAGSETGTGQPIVLTQRDVRELQLASGAIRAGIGCLLQRAGLRPRDLGAVLIAGGFGNFIRRSNAQRIGLLPADVARRRIRYQGNTSLAGARLVAISRQARASAEELARRTEHVDLSTDPDFHTAFAEAMVFPTAER